MDKYEKVSWIRQAQLNNGTLVSVSGKSGIVKIEVPRTGKRAPVLYADEIRALLACSVELQRYLDDHDDVVFSKDQAIEARTIKANQGRAAANAAKGLQALGFTNEEIAEMLKNKVG